MKRNSKEFIEYLKRIGFKKGNKINKGRKSSMLGRHHTEETKNKIRIAHLGMKLSEEEKKRRKEIYSKLPKETKLKISRIGTKHSKETKKKISNALKGKPAWNKGKKLSKEHIRKVTLASIGRKHTKEAIKKMSDARIKFITPKRDTSIEVKIQNFLSKLHIEYLTHKYISEITHSYHCDIFIPVQEGIKQKTIIECDGCYWHGCPICKLNKPRSLEKQRQNDKFRTKELEEKGFKVIRLWEHEIKNINQIKLMKVLNEK